MSGERRAILLYDADCAFCRWALRRVQAWDRARHLRPLALQDPEAERLLSDLSEGERLASWHLIDLDGRRYSAGRALAPLLRLLPGALAPALARIVESHPRLFDAGYAWTARHRSHLSRIVRMLGGQRGRGGRCAV